MSVAHPPVVGYRTRDLSDRRCAFCGRPRSEVKKLVAGPNAYICERCVAVCKQLLTDERRPQIGSTPEPRSFKPRELKERLDEWVIGQERAKKILTVAVYNHWKRTQLRIRGDAEVTKSNILVLGPPGTGKTHLARTLARLIDVPFALADATPLTQAGYVGEDVESVVAKLLRAAEGSLERAQHGIIYIDEIDKLAKRPGHDRDVSGEGVQQGLLKLLEGKKVLVRTGQERTGVSSDTVELDTANILFIAGGAFDGLVQQVQRRMKEATGFRPGGRQDAEACQSYEAANNEDLARFGFLPEFLGRFPVRVTLQPLDEEALVRILTEPKDALIRQYQRLFQMDGARLECSSDGLRAIAQAALLRKTGARGLRAVLEELLLDVMFELPAKRGRWLLDAASAAEGTLRRLNERTAA